MQVEVNYQAAPAPAPPVAPTPPEKHKFEFIDSERRAAKIEQVLILVDSIEIFETKYPTFFNRNGQPEGLDNPYNDKWNNYFALSYHILIQEKNADSPIIMDRTFSALEQKWLREIWWLFWRVTQYDLSVLQALDGPHLPALRVLRTL